MTDMQLFLVALKGDLIENWFYCGIRNNNKNCLGIKDEI